MWLSDFIKRLFDIVTSFIVLCFFAPFYLLIAITIKHETPGPAFYRGLRIGKNGKTFKILKFRTMYETPQSYTGPRVTAQDDPRVTPLGRWLRNTKLNEFPQFWNVLRGEMSLVGPRPEDPNLAKTWPAKIAKEILRVRPGITSPASVLYRDEESMLHTEELLQKYFHILTPDKMRLDLLYVRYRSFWLDLDTILWTALLLFPKIREYSPPEKILFLGPISRLFQRYARWYLLDFLVAFICIGITGISLRLFTPLNLGWLTAFLLAIGFALIYSLVGAILGVNRISWTKATLWDSTRLFADWVIATGMALILFPRLGMTNSPTYELIIGSALLSLLGFLIIRYRTRLVIGLLGNLVRIDSGADAKRERVLIIGTGRTAENIAWFFNHPAYKRNFQIVGFIEDDLLLQGLKVYGARVIGTNADLKDIIKRYDVGLVVLADYRMTESDSVCVCEIVQQTAARAFVAPDIFGSLNELRHSSSDNVPIAVDSFQCQHCIARYSIYDPTNEYLIPSPEEID